MINDEKEITTFLWRKLMDCKLRNLSKKTPPVRTRETQYH
jgi:hypothetical protein